MEIERKFLVKQIPNNLYRYIHNKIEQYYICFNPEIRIRKINDFYFLTIKSDGDILREEVEIPIDREIYEKLKCISNFGGIIKNRYLIPYEKYTCELDIYDNIKELVVVEVEFNSLKEASNFIIPEWFGDEVTNKDEFKNKNLARYGLILN